MVKITIVQKGQITQTEWKSKEVDNGNDYSPKQGMLHFVEIDLECCRAKVSNGYRTVTYHQCTNKPKYGEYCGIHRKDKK